VLAALRSVDWRGLGVGWAVLYGSLARRGSGRDVDLLIEPSGPSGRDPGWLLDVIVWVAEALRVDPGLVDVVEFRRAPCAVVREAWRLGIPVYEARRGLARDRLLVAVKVCHDYELARRKLRVAETAVRAMRRRWS
jgi:hypothetical protein